MKLSVRIRRLQILVFRKMLRTHLAIQLLTIPSFHGTQIPVLFLYSEVLINYPKDHEKKHLCWTRV